ncbi:MAG: deoxyribose-phosphate aldolase [Thermoprotei archaeon]|nr:MAG: deoxyribose-phosphate aldolase [Thermoprotei archaeon]
MNELLNQLRSILTGISSRIDQTMLKYDVTLKSYEEFVEKSDGYGFRALVVPSTIVPYVSSIARTPVAGVVAFPYGYTPLEAKLSETEFVAKSGGREVDVVINLVWAKSHKYSAIEEEVKRITERAHELGLRVKFIVETSILTDEELVGLARIVMKSGADFIKTNTGYGSRGVNPRDILLIRRVTKGAIKIKASGGIRNAIDASLYILLGADVIGSSSGIRIVEDASKVIDLF